jgi:hypothetical protein
VQPKLHTPKNAELRFIVVLEYHKIFEISTKRKIPLVCGIKRDYSLFISISDFNIHYSFEINE